MYKVKAATENVVYIEIIPNAEDFQSACSMILKYGLMTSDEDGPIWYPLHQIKYVRMYDE